MSFVSNCYTATVYLVIIFQHTVPIPNLNKGRQAAMF